MKARGRNQAGKALTAEFAVALTVFLLVTLFPLINLIGFAMGAGTQYLMTVQCAGGAGASTSFNDALSAMDREAVLFANSGFGQFAKLHPVGGHNGTGTDLYLIETSLGASNSLAYGPNTGGPAALNSDNNVYEYQVRSTFDVGPFVNMASMPWVGDIPGIGRPARLSFVAHRNCEFTEGLAMGATGVPIVAAAGGGGAGSSGGSGSGSGVTGVSTTGVVATTAGSGSGPFSVASGGGATDPTILARNSASSSSSSSGGLADLLRRRRNNNNSSSNVSTSSTTTTTTQNSTTNSNQTQSAGFSTSVSGLGTNSGTLTQTAQNSTTNGTSTSTNASTTISTPAPQIPNTTLSASASVNAAPNSNSSSYNYTNNTGPNTVGGVVVSSNQSGSGNQSQNSSSSTPAP